MILFACVIFCNINNGTVTERERGSKSGFMTNIQNQKINRLLKDTLVYL